MKKNVRNTTIYHYNAFLFVRWWEEGRFVSSRPSAKCSWWYVLGRVMGQGQRVMFVRLVTYAENVTYVYNQGYFLVGDGGGGGSTRRKFWQR